MQGKKGSNNPEKKEKASSGRFGLVTDENDKICVKRISDEGTNNNSHIGNERDGSYNGNANTSVSDNEYSFTVKGEEEV